MPGASIGIQLSIGRIREGAMDVVAVGHAARSVGRRAYERMTKAHTGTELDQPFRLGRRLRIGADPEQLSSAPQQNHIADRFGRR